MTLYRVTADLLVDVGDPWTLRRQTIAAGANAWTAGTETISYLPQQAMRRIDKPQDAGGLVRDAQAVLIMSPDFTAPHVDDRAARGTLSGDTGIDWFEIVHVDSVYVEGQLARYYAWIRS